MKSFCTLSALFLTLIFSLSNLYSKEVLTREWGTYYGGSMRDWSEATAVDPEGNVIIAGKTENKENMSTQGAFQETYGGGTYDCLLAKFSSSGDRIWSTYIGGTDNDNIVDIVCDENGDIYITGGTRSPQHSIFATQGAYQEEIDGDLEAFIMKFDKDGNRIWGTYFGGELLDKGQSIVLDIDKNIIICGRTESENNIASEGAHQENFRGDTDGFIAKFTNDGELIWSTYYGGNTFEYIFDITTDTELNIIAIGRTNSIIPENCIATENSHQETFGAGTGQDAFLVKFNKDGNRLWGTYYGGNNNEQGKTVICDDMNNIYISGFTKSTKPENSIASIGSHQEKLSGKFDAFIAKFDKDGYRIWGTYYGGSGDDFASALAWNANDNVWLCGSTKSSSPKNSIASEDGYKSNFGGTQDAYLANFDKDGNRLWASYYGGEGNDNVTSIALNNDAIYFSGLTGTKNQSTEIASEAAFQTNFGGHNNDCFIAKFSMQEIIDKPNEAVVLIDPENEIELIKKNIEFTWEESASAEFYHIIVLGNTDTPFFEDKQHPISNGNIQSLNINNFKFNVTYNWKVRAGNSGGYGPWSDTWSFIVLDPSSVDDIEKNLIRLYPNPSREKITILGYEGEYEIINSFGFTVQQGIINSNNSLNVTNLHNGVYYIRVGTIILSFIKL